MTVTDHVYHYILNTYLHLEIIQDNCSLQPKNLLISCERGREIVKLIDFGLAIETNQDKQEWYGKYSCICSSIKLQNLF